MCSISGCTLVLLCVWGCQTVTEQETETWGKEKKVGALREGLNKKEQFVAMFHW